MSGENARGSQDTGIINDAEVQGVPESFQYATLPITVLQEREDGDGFEEVGDIFRAQDVTRGIGDAVDVCNFLFGFHELAEPMRGDGGSFQPDYLARAVARLSPDRLIRVLVSHADPAFSKCLFEGYVATATVTWSSSPESHNQGIHFACDSILSRWRTDIEAQVIGRWVHGNLPDPPEFIEENLRLIENQPCVFNEGGEPNCSPHPFEVTIPFDDGEVTVPLYVFAPRDMAMLGPVYDEQPPIPWTFARAVFYLIYMYGRRAYPNPTDLPPIGLPRGLLDKLADGLIDMEPVDDPLVIEDPLERALLLAPKGLQTDRTSLLEALSMLSSAGDLHFHVDHDIDGGDVLASDYVKSSINIWATGQTFKNTIRIRRGVPRLEPPTSPQLALAENKHMSADLTYDSRSVTNAPLVVGGEKRYEVTVELVPGWLIHENLDDVEEDDWADARAFWELPPLWREEAVPPHLRKYLLGDVNHAEVADVGRLWVLNEAGRYQDEDAFGNPLYARELGPPHDAAAYAPFDFSYAGIVDYKLQEGEEEPVPVGLEEERWARVPRPLRDPLTHLPEERVPPRVDASFDDGATWETVDVPVHIAEKEAAIVFTPTSPLEVHSAAGGPFGDNMFFAIIERRFRVRVSGVVIGDDFLIPRRSVAAVVPGSPMSQTMSRVYDRPNFEQWLRLEAGSVLSTPPIPLVDPGGEERRELLAADTWRKAVGRRMGDRQVSGRASTPWLDTTVEISFRVSSVDGVGLSTQRRSDPEPVFPQIVAIRHRLVHPQETTFTIGDFRHEPNIPQEAEQ